jgi:hypothetical protein
MTVCLYLCGVSWKKSAFEIWEDSKEYRSDHLSKTLCKNNILEVGIPFAYCTRNADKILRSKVDLQL